jgi:hypothetical protein
VVNCKQLVSHISQDMTLKLGEIGVCRPTATTRCHYCS